MKHALVVPAEAHGKRVDVFVGDALSLSRAKVKALFEGDSIRIDGRRAKKGVALQAGQKIDVEVTETSSTAVADADLSVPVLWEDDVLVFVNKPARVPSQPLAPNERGTVANALVSKYPGIEEVGDDPREAGLCHRLDVETSGVMVAAKTREAWLAVREQFSGDGSGGSGPGSIDKRYLALVDGPIADEGTIDVGLAHHGDHVRVAVLPTDDARPARSHFTVERRAGTRALVSVRIETGVLHQVRAHLAAIGAPIAGDALYGGKALPALERFFLHASSLTVRHPVTGKPVRVECPLPDDLRSVHDAIFVGP
ncbi:MAG: RluA family pseudouridine synthase [Archangium sp.]|nr:RluA family pseudouridine synthase [Archangium sp.]